MPRQSIGNSSVGIYNPLSILIGAHPAGDYRMSWIRSFTYPTQIAPANISTYAQAAGQYLFQIQIRSSNGSFGYVSISFPWYEDTASLGTAYIGGSKQVYNYTYPYITINATRTYPYLFQYWQIDGGGVYSYSNPLDIYSTDSVITNNQKLIAVFA